MELKLLDLYPPQLEIEGKRKFFVSYYTNLIYLNRNTLYQAYYDEPLGSNRILQEWNDAKKK